MQQALTECTPGGVSVAKCMEGPGRCWGSLLGQLLTPWFKSQLWLCDGGGEPGGLLAQLGTRWKVGVHPAPRRAGGDRHGCLARSELVTTPAAPRHPGNCLAGVE